MRRRATQDELKLLRARAAFQWDWTVANKLFQENVEYILDISRGKIKYIILEGEVYLTLRPNDGLFSLSLKAGEVIRRTTEPPRYRVIVRGDREIKGSVLARDIVAVDSDLRAGDEVLVVDTADRLLGVGRLRVPPLVLEGLEYGEIARVRSRVK